MEKKLYLLIVLMLISTVSLSYRGRGLNLPINMGDISKVERSGAIVKDPTANHKPSSAQGITVNKIPFSVLSGDAIPESISTYSEKNREAMGYKAFEDKDGKYIVLICSGQRNTGGYGISVKSVEDIEGKTSIIVEETKPEPGTIVNKMVTYPRVFIKIGNIAPNFIIKNTEGTSFPEYND